MDTELDEFTRHGGGQESDSEQRYFAGGIQRADAASARHYGGNHPHLVAGTGRFQQMRPSQILAEVPQ